MRLFFGFLLGACILASSLIAADQGLPNLQRFSKEITALLSSKDFSRSLDKAWKALPKGYTLKVVATSWGKIGEDSTYAYVYVSKVNTAVFPGKLEPFGHIAGKVDYNPEGMASVASTYYMPMASLPGTPTDR